MNFRVGPFVYRVVLVQGHLQHEGDPCLGLCDNERHELLISDQASEAQQVQIICHEYMEAWLYHFAPQLTADPAKEQWCDLFGLAMTQFVLDLVRTLRESEGQTPFNAGPVGDAARVGPSLSATTPKRRDSKAVRPIRASDLPEMERWRSDVLSRLARGFGA